jgi:hypothetical protein
MRDSTGILKIHREALTFAITASGTLFFLRIFPQRNAISVTQGFPFLYLFAKEEWHLS